LDRRKKIGYSGRKFYQKHPKKELSDFTSQIRKAATSVPFNITEGCRKQNSEEILQLMNNAGGSLYGLENQLNSSLDQNYISEEILER
jgi:four helix bundle protein